MLARPACYHRGRWGDAPLSGRQGSQHRSYAALPKPDAAGTSPATSRVHSRTTPV